MIGWSAGLAVVDPNGSISKQRPQVPSALHTFTLPEGIEFPSLLDTPKPVLRAYTEQTALAGRLEAMVSLGERVSRMKDYFDIWLLSRRLDFQGARRTQAAFAAFDRRNTEFSAKFPKG